MSKKKPKIVFAPSTVVDALEPYIQEIQQALAELTGHKGIMSAFISDESCISDFLDAVPTGETKPHPFDGREIEVVTADTTENQQLMSQLIDRLGVKVEIYDYLYDVALRIRDTTK